jgi:3-hydroxyacyl-CoA dehydrogenase
MFSQRRRESEKLILEGALPAQVDKVVYEFGFPMGPFQLYDLIGNDLGWSKETSTGESIRDLICEQGRFGLKASKGYYNYDAGSRVPKPAPEVDQLIVEFSQKKGYKRREISDEEILQRCVYPIINEGAKILEEKIAVRPSDLDVIWINGYGWPLYRGGPMFYADLVGLDKVLDVMKKFQAEHGDDFKPAALLEKLVKEGKKFASLN